MESILEICLAQPKRTSLNLLFQFLLLLSNHATHSLFLSMLCTKLVVSHPHDVWCVFFMLMSILVSLEEPAQI